eukprot:g1629.t1
MKRVSEAANAFARWMDARIFKFDPMHSPPLFETVSDAPIPTLEEALDLGDHLSHYHSYSRISKRESSAKQNFDIDMHTDQGLFVGFIPAGRISTTNLRIVEKEEDEREFWIELSDGSRDDVIFEDDTIVFMIGDALLQALEGRSSILKNIRPTPHAVRLLHRDSRRRAWFGVMFLPPAHAISKSRGISYDRLRKLAVAQATSDEGSTVGCSQNLIARELTASACEADELFCWMRCMGPTTDASPSICASQNLQYQCASQYDQIWDPEVDSHGDYNPTCTNSTAAVTEVPQLPASPDNCSGWAEFVQFENYASSLTLKGSGVYDHHHNTNGSDIDAVLLWNVVNGSIDAKLAYNGRVGWLSIGIASTDPSASHEGMNGANIVMGLVEPEMFDEHNLGTSVHEFQISLHASAFRHWNEPLSGHTDPIQNARIDVSGNCFTSIAFNATAIGGESLRIGQAHDPVNLIWGVHTTTAHMGYHGYSNRGTIVGNFSFTGHAVATSSSDGGGHQHDDHTHESSSDDGNDELLYVGIGLGTVVVLVILISAYFVAQKGGSSRIRKSRGSAKSASVVPDETKGSASQ